MNLKGWKLAEAEAGAEDPFELLADAKSGRDPQNNLGVGRTMRWWPIGSRPLWLHKPCASTQESPCRQLIYWYNSEFPSNNPDLLCALTVLDSRNGAAYVPLIQTFFCNNHSFRNLFRYYLGDPPLYFVHRPLGSDVGGCLAVHVSL